MFTARLAWLGGVLVAGAAALSSCSDDREPTGSATVLPAERPTDAIEVQPDASARARAVAERIVAWPNLAGPRWPLRFDRTASGYRARFAAGQRRGWADVILPERADAPIAIADPSSGLSLRARLVDAAPVQAEVHERALVYPDALGAGAHLAHLPRPGGTEDLVLLEAPGIGELRYVVELGEGVAGLRHVGRTLELIDAGGAPRLRVAPPWVAGADGQRRAAALHLEGCAADTSAAPPWGRAPQRTGARTCSVVVRWDSHGLVHPVLVDPVWSTTLAMAQERARHIAARLGDGRVLVAGGSNGDIFGLDGLTAAEVYDPGTETWAAASPMSTPRRDFPAVVLANGRVLVTGGATDGADPPVASAEIFDPATGNWTPTATPMTTAREEHQATLLSSGRVLVTAGLGGTGSTYLASAEELDPVTLTWTAVDSLTLARAAHTATALVDGRVLVTGGTGDVYPFDFASCEIYDPATKTWEATADMAVNRGYHTATRLGDGTVMVTGGFGFNLFRGDTEVFDPASGANGSWTTKGTLSPPRDWHTATLLDNGFVLVAAGEEPGQSNEGLSSKSASLYDPGTGAWTQTQSLLFWRYLHTATLLDDGRVLVAGGIYTDPVIGLYAIDDAELFTPFSLGTQCTSSGECTSQFCVDGVCCDSACEGVCMACDAALTGSGEDGVCAPIAKGSDPQDECTDDGGTSCEQDGTCDGAGACGEYAGPGCAGRPCREDAECTSGHCAAGDGVCCDSTCEGSCQSCAVSKKGQGSDGECGPIAKGTDPDGECMSSSSSDCGAIALCDGVSSCAASTVVCAPYTCLDDSKCHTSCGTDEDCTAEYRCDDGTCVLRQPGCEGSVAVSADGDEIDCAPYLCQADGSCRSSCNSAAECVAPFVCDAGGKCVALGDGGDGEDGGCGCRLPGGDPGTSGGASWLVLALAVLARRRGRAVAELGSP